MSYINEFAANVGQGTRGETTYVDQFFFGGWSDLQRLVSLPEARIVFSLTDRNGESMDESYDG